MEVDSAPEIAARPVVVPVDRSPAIVSQHYEYCQYGVEEVVKITCRHAEKLRSVVVLSKVLYSF